MCSGPTGVPPGPVGQVADPLERLGVEQRHDLTTISATSAPRAYVVGKTGLVQVVGGVVLLSGVVAVRLGERDEARRDARAVDADFDVPSPVA